MTFTKFSEAGRLYAANIEVVREMEKAYRADVSAFLEVFEREVQRLVAPEELNVYQTKDANRYLWLGKNRTRTDAPYLWFTNYNTDDIDHEGIVLTAGFERKDDAVLEGLGRLRDNGKELHLDPIDGASRYYIFAVPVDFDGDDFMEVGARRVAAVLKAMNEIERATPNRKPAR
jgi:hypothetical protein